MLIRVSRDHLKSLASQTQATAHLAIREGKQALFIDHAVGNSVIAVTGQTGELIPFVRVWLSSWTLTSSCANSQP
jgi:DNA-binding IclR family transcriptional regulator